MASNQKSTLSKPAKPVKALYEVLDQSEHVAELVQESAAELSTVNIDLKHELIEHNSPPFQNALGKSEAVETKIHEASEQLTIVNEALENEVREREVLEKQLSTAKSQEEAARHAAFHDSLTGLPNRVLFNDRLEHALVQAKRHVWKLAVIFIDLDDFKSINDSYGHHVGDSVLRVISDRLKTNTRVDDTVCRHGGDEFLYLLMEIKSERDVISIVEKLIAKIEEPCEVDITGLTIRPVVRASIGIAIYPKDGETAETLIKNADKAMYRAKRSHSGYATIP